MRHLPYCFFVFFSLSVFYSAQCQINITPTSFCAGDTVILNASALIESQEGTNNSSLQFSSGNYMRIPISDALSDFEQVTIEFWYYQISSGEEFIIATEYFNTGWGFHNENPNILQWRVEGGPYSLGGSNFSIPNNEWIHVAGVYDSQELRLYVDGNLIASEAYTGTISDSRNEDIVVNRHVWASGSSSRLSGYLDELRISGIARYNDNFTPPEYDFVSDEQTLGLWHFDDLSGNMLSDDSGFNNHGQSNGVGTTSNVPYSDYNTASNVSYVWSNGETQTAIQVVPIDQSPYSVVVENGGTTIEETIVLNPNMTCCPGPGCCLDGQTWDWDQMGCVITNPTDTNLDGCTNLTDLMDILSAYGDCSVPAFNCGDDIEHEDYVYSSVQIGEQCWFAENCRYLPVVSSPLLGSEEGGLAYAYVYNYYGDDIEAAKLENSYIKSGALYNVQAIESWVLCPNHWHAAHESDWLALEEEIGIEIDQLEILGWRGSTEGYNLKVNDCDGSWNGSNIYGFSARGHGTRSDLEKDFIDYCIDGNYHTLTNGTAEYYRRAITSYQNGIYRDNASIHAGMGVRCIKD